MTGSPTRDPNLTWLLDALWGSSDDSSGVGLAYRVIPSARRARMLVPDDAALAALALRSGGGARSLGSHATRAAAAVLVLGGAFRDRVHAPPDDPLLGAIREACGVDEALLACAVRRPGPFRKPVLQVLVPDGRVIAYAKVAWNEATAANVRAEHVALTSLRGAAHIRAPIPIAMVEHRGYPMLLTEPMPAALRRYRGDDPPADLAVTRSVADVLDVSPGADPIGTRLRSRLAATSPTDLASVHTSTGALLDALGERTAALETGAWHGDWSSWNLGWEDGRLWAWDWEYCRSDVPVGLDLPHFVFQRRFIADRVPVDRAFRESFERSAPLLTALGYGPSTRATVHAVHVAEVTLRYLEASSLGVAPNPRFIAGAEHAIGRAIDVVG
jgi:hypothetical protein